MRSKNTMNATLLGLIASAAFAAGCSHDTGHGDAAPSLLAQNGVTMPASLEATAAPSTPGDLVHPVSTPVDLATGNKAWKEGVARFDGGDYRGAAELLKTAVAGSPEASYRHYLLGLALVRSGDAAGAEDALVESARLDPTRVRAWINLARVRNERGNRTGALEAADKALEVDPASSDAMHQKGRALMELNRSDEALTVLEAARGADGTNGYIANTLGLLLIQLNRPADAVSPLEAAKTVLPHVAYVRNNLGVAYERTGRIDEAKIEYLAAVEAGDSGGKATSSLARLGPPETTGTVTAASASNGN
jgi:Flp pilus assembly protein TadD